LVGLPDNSRASFCFIDVFDSAHRFPIKGELRHRVIVDNGVDAAVLARVLAALERP
jgi:hypothetical protein